jgi:SmpA / OmlA family
MKAARNLVLALLTAGCALIPGRNLEPGKSTRADVVAEMGQPALSLERPGGGQLLYFTFGPWAQLTYMATIGPDGVLRAWQQALTYANIHSVHAGMTRDEVRRLLGPPNEIGRLPRQQREVWEYPWRHAASEGRVLWVQFSDDGVVREAIERHDDKRDPEGGEDRL